MHRTQRQEMKTSAALDFCSFFFLSDWRGSNQWPNGYVARAHRAHLRNQRIKLCPITQATNNMQLTRVRLL
jgi:hypothetical protein